MSYTVQIRFQHSSDDKVISGTRIKRKILTKTSVSCLKIKNYKEDFKRK